uniref:Cuticle protein 13 n=1 Tax=Antheraea yamamai TaxID=7121 RepID=Q5PXD9_ANTYA|nr:cuticle protein 13 [Antheraea yamamai]
MKLLIILSVIVLVTAAPPPINNAQDNVSLLKYNYENDGTGLYNYAFEQSDGTKQEQHGELRNAGTENESLFVKGSFTWIGPDGVTYIVRYEAGEEGYKPEIEEGPGGAVHQM